MRRWIAAVAVSLLLIAALPSLSWACGVTGRDCPPPPDHDGGGVGYYYDSQTRTFYPTASNDEGSESDGGIQWLTRYVVVCGLNDVDSPADDFCTDAACETADGFGYVNQVFRRLTSTEPWVPWPGRERECRVFGPDEEPITLEEFEERIITTIEEHYSKIARPTITIAPPVDAVVNLPVIASTPDAGDVGFGITEPLPGRVEASPSYGWTWSNGQADSGPGQPYDGTDPAAAPGHYPVHAVYTRGGDGSVDLAATWSIVLTVDGIPPIEDIEPLVYDATASFAVRNATTIIVD